MCYNTKLTDSGLRMKGFPFSMQPHFAVCCLEQATQAILNETPIWNKEL